jgi:hypothetical protein
VAHGVHGNGLPVSWAFTGFWLKPCGNVQQAALVHFFDDVLRVPVGAMAQHGDLFGGV